MSLTPEELNALAQQETRFFAGVANISEEKYGIFLTRAAFPDYVGANRVLALREDGRGAKAIADEVVMIYRARGVLPAVEVDDVAEAQGLGAELRRRGFRWTDADRLLMRYEQNTLPQISQKFPVERVRNDSGNDETHDWLEVAVSMEEDAQDREEWREILRCDARESSHELYLVRADDAPAACCQLFSNDGYGRIDDVATRPEFQRRGLAFAVVAHAVQVSIKAGNHTTFLYCDADSPAEALYRKLGFTVWARNPFRRHIQR